MDPFHSAQLQPGYQQPPPRPRSHAPSTQMRPPASPTQLSHSNDKTDRARAYKSRNKRPCDFCRYKKAACHLENQPPCELCLRHGKKCTFVESPAKRRRPNEQKLDAECDQNSDVLEHSFGAEKYAGTGAIYGNATLQDTNARADYIDWDTRMPPDDVSNIDSSSGGIVPGDGVGTSLYNEPIILGGTDHQQVASPTRSNHAPLGRSLHNENSSSLTTGFKPIRGGVSTASSGLLFENTLGEPSLERQASSNAQMVGLSGATDPYILSRLRYDQYDEAKSQSLRVRRVDNRSAMHKSSLPCFFAIRHSTVLLDGVPHYQSDGDELCRTAVDALVDDGLKERLSFTFHQSIQPHFPIISNIPNILCHPTSRIAPGVEAAMYGHAVYFENKDNHARNSRSSEALFQISWEACLTLLHTPNLALLQALLLLSQRRSLNSQTDAVAFTWSIMSTAVSVVQTLGLNRDPSNWTLPAWESSLRKRLAWATYTQEKWLALTSGRSSHIHAKEDWDVPLLTQADFLDHEEIENVARKGSHHFIHLCTLTLIVDDILQHLFSVKATKTLHSSIEATIEVAKPLRIRLTEWYQSLPPGIIRRHLSATTESSFDVSNFGLQRSHSHDQQIFPIDLEDKISADNCSLHLAYITAKIQLFRAMLRPQATEYNQAAFNALRTGAAAVAREAFEFLDSLTTRDIEGFWASYSSTSFTTASNFILLLFVTSPSLIDAKASLNVLLLWRTTLRSKHRNGNILDGTHAALEELVTSGLDETMVLSPAAIRAWQERDISA